MPDLGKMKNVSDLLEATKLLTHPEGMGVISPFKLRLREGDLGVATIEFFWIQLKGREELMTTSRLSPHLKRTNAASCEKKIS